MEGDRWDFWDLPLVLFQSLISISLNFWIKSFLGHFQREYLYTIVNLALSNFNSDIFSPEIMFLKGSMKVTGTSSTLQYYVYTETFMYPSMACFKYIKVQNVSFSIKNIH